MNVDPVGFLPPLQPLAVDAASAADAGGFAAWMSRETAAANDQLLQADHLLQRLAAGETTNLHQVMIGVEQARLTFQLFVQVRNRLLESYQDILRMQV